jgi:Tol biopolymer transport system component/C-terminal processing protease CtpA/Prc
MNYHQKMRVIFLIVCVMCLSAFTKAQEVSWLRYPAISPDGSTIVFTYKGDLYKVSSSGGQATQLTQHEAHDYMPIWSADSRNIAFASDRYGNFDVFIIPASGGEAKRITFHSAQESPYCFTPDGSGVVFGASRLDAAANRQFPAGYMPELYSVSVQGGRVHQILTTPAEDVQFSVDGKTLYYHDKKGGENNWRKHQTSAIARDVWAYNMASGTHTKLTNFLGEDRTPVPAANGATIYYLSEANGSFNVYQMKTDGSSAAALTQFKTHPVRFLTAAKNNTLCFSYNGEIYTHLNGKSQVLKINIAADKKNLTEQLVPVGDGVADMQLSPDGKEVAFIFRGDVFVSNTNGKGTKQVTKTPEQETDVTWHKEGRMLAYASERNGKWGIYKTEMVREQEIYFYASTLLKESRLVSSTESVQAPQWSPDGKELAYTEDFTTLKVLNLASSKSRTLVTPKEWLSWGDGGHYVRWSPDSKWLLTGFANQCIGNGEIGILSADGKTPLTNLSLNGFGDYAPNWMMGGKMLLWFSNRDGLASKANSGGGQSDAYGLFLTAEAWDDFKLSKDEAALAKDIKEKAAKADTTKKDEKESEEVDSVMIDWNGLEYRKARLTLHSSDLSDALVDRKGEKLYYLARFEEGSNLWCTDLRKKETKMLASLDADYAGNMQWDSEGENIWMQSDGSIIKIEAAGGDVTPAKINGDMLLDMTAERAIMFDHVTRRTNDIFYKKDFHGVNWNALSANYRSFLPHIGNGYEFSELLSELLGELNVSHCGSRFGGMESSVKDVTASLGIFLDYAHTGNGIRLSEVMTGGPLDKAGFNIEPGTVIESIDGEVITNDRDYPQYLNRKAGKTVLLVISKDGNTRELLVKPISPGEEADLLYKRWVKRNAAEVTRLSNGLLGYIHIPGMDDRAYRTAIEEAMGKYAACKGLVVDTRNNGGGDLVADLAMWLSGKRFMEYSNDREIATYEPTFRWNKPSISLANEGNYSDGHCYAFTYQYLKLGKLVGMPVPGTCSFAGWEMLQDGATLWGTVPMGAKVMDGSGRYLENLQTEPDIKLMNEYNKVNTGKDQQLEVAIQTLLQEIK